MPSKGKGFQRLAAVEVTDSDTDDDSQPLRSTKRSATFPCCKLCWCGTVALVLLALCVAMALGAYLLYGMHLEMVSLREEMVSLREEVARLQEQGSSGKATLLVLQNRTLSGLQQLQSTLHRLNAVRTVSRGGNSTTLNSIRQELDHIGDMLEGSFAVDINKLSHKVLNLSAEVLSAVVSAEQAQNSSAACLAALGQHYRLQGDLHNDVYLLKRANRTLTKRVSLLRSNLQALSLRWSSAMDSFNNSLLAMQLAEAIGGPCTNCCSCDHQPPSKPAMFLSTLHSAPTPQWGVAGSTTALPSSLPAIQPSQASMLPELTTCISTGAFPDDLAGHWDNTPQATALNSVSHLTTERPPDHTPQPSTERPPDHTPQPSTERPPDHTPQLSTERPPDHTPQPSTERPPDHSPQPSTERPPDHTPQPSTERPPDHTPQLSTERPPDHTPQPSTERPPDHTPQPNTERPPDHTPQPNTERPPDHTPQLSIERPPDHTPQPSTERPPDHTPQPSTERPPEHSPQPSTEPPPGNREQFTELLSVVESIRDSFNSSDEDADRRLSREEFLQHLQLPGQATADLPDQFFTLCDRDGDSFVDAEELQTVLTHIRNKLASPSSSLPVF